MFSTYISFLKSEILILSHQTCEGYLTLTKGKLTEKMPGRMLRLFYITFSKMEERMVYVQNQRKQSLMPTRFQKARKLLKENKAIIIYKEPFTIRLLYPTGESKQKVVLGVDAGSKNIGISASTEKKELYSAEINLRNDISELIAVKKQYRRGRRYRKVRYRKAKFNNRVKHKKWLAPSIQNKINSHKKVIQNVYSILPISRLIIEVASFDIQKINNPEISGEDYQKGEQLVFWNVREYVMFRDGYKCQGKKNCTNKILNVHHIESRKTGGDSPGNLITLCKKCHKAYHKGILELNITRKKSFKDASFMGIMRWQLYNNLKETYRNVSLTYGYITKNIRIKNGFNKCHRVDAFCITKNIHAEQMQKYFMIKQVRKKKRNLYEATTSCCDERSCGEYPRRPGQGQRLRV